MRFLGLGLVLLGYMLIYAAVQSDAAGHPLKPWTEPVYAFTGKAA